MGIPINFDGKEFFEFIWHFERFAEHRKKENEEAIKSQGAESLNGMAGGINRA